MALADAITGLLDDPARGEALGKAAREIVRRKFSLQTMVAQTEALYLSETVGNQP
jgi:glycosyltransferase involved in cell wall biosynthesis